jgi:hypothetical protein
LFRRNLDNSVPAMATPTAAAATTTIALFLIFVLSAGIPSVWVILDKVILTPHAADVIIDNALKGRDLPDGNVPLAAAVASKKATHRWHNWRHGCTAAPTPRPTRQLGGPRKRGTSGTLLLRTKHAGARLEMRRVHPPRLRDRR